MQHKEKNGNNKGVYKGRNVGFAAVFMNITKRGELPEEASIHTAEITAIKTVLREIQKRENKRWLIYTNSLSSILAIKSNRENHQY